MHADRHHLLKLQICSWQGRYYQKWKLEILLNYSLSFYASDMSISSRIEKAALLSASHSFSVTGVKRPPDAFPIMKDGDCLSWAISVADKRARRPRRARGMDVEALSVIE